MGNLCGRVGNRRANLLAKTRRVSASQGLVRCDEATGSEDTSGPVFVLSAFSLERGRELRLLYVAETGCRRRSRDADQLRALPGGEEDPRHPDGRERALDGHGGGRV